MIGKIPVKQLRELSALVSQLADYECSFLLTLYLIFLSKGVVIPAFHSVLLPMVWLCSPEVALFPYFICEMHMCIIVGKSESPLETARQPFRSY